MPSVSICEKDEENSSEKCVSLENQCVLFDGLDNQGITLPHGCLAGSCGSCRIEVLEGEENLSPPSAVERDTLSHIRDEYEEKYGKEFLEGKTIRLSCRAKILGNVKIRPLKK